MENLQLPIWDLDLVGAFPPRPKDPAVASLEEWRMTLDQFDPEWFDALGSYPDIVQHFDLTSQTQLAYISMFLKYALTNLTLQLSVYRDANHLKPMFGLKSHSQSVLVGSSNEGLAIPLVNHPIEYTRDIDITAVCDEYDVDELNDTATFRLIICEDDGRFGELLITHPEMFLSSSEIKEQRSGVYPKKGNFYLSRDKWQSAFIRLRAHDGVAGCIRNDPALTSDLVGNSNVPLDMCYAMALKEWPSSAKNWSSRLRMHGWPSSSVIQDCLAAQVQIVPRGRHGKGSPYEWRLSFSSVYKVLANKLSLAQRKAYIVLKMLQKNFFNAPGLSSYNLKNLFMWACEKTSMRFWSEGNLAMNIIYLLEELQLCLLKAELRHYFASGSNLLSSLMPEFLNSALQKVVYVRKNLIHCVDVTFEKFILTGYGATHCLKYVMLDNSREISIDLSSVYTKLAQRLNKEILNSIPEDGVAVESLQEQLVTCGLAWECLLDSCKMRPDANMSRIQDIWTRVDFYAHMIREPFKRDIDFLIRMINFGSHILSGVEGSEMLLCVGGIQCLLYPDPPLEQTLDFLKQAMEMQDSLATRTCMALYYYYRRDYSAIYDLLLPLLEKCNLSDFSTKHAQEVIPTSALLLLYNNLSDLELLFPGHVLCVYILLEASIQLEYKPEFLFENKDSDRFISTLLNTKSLDGHARRMAWRVEEYFQIVVYGEVDIR